MEISYNQKSSPKKLFAETSKKNKHIYSDYQNGVLNTNYITCFTEENEKKGPDFVENLDKNMTKYIVSLSF